jgi:F1F0 ATPase subunit 2
MNDGLKLFAASLAGILLGAVFFGGLWLTIRVALASKHPAAWFLGSLVLRSAAALAGFYLVSGGNWHRLAACLAGFVVARLAVTWLTSIPVGANAPAPGGVAR